MSRRLLALAGLAYALALPCRAGVVLAGSVSDPRGFPAPGARVTLMDRSGARVTESAAADSGDFRMEAPGAGDYRISVEAPGFGAVTQSLHLSESGVTGLRLQLTNINAIEQSVTVTGDIRYADILSPDPAQRVFIRDEILDANPGRPGAPVSIPGLPIETASGGIKAPQYFAPGVAGDHGEPIATFWQVGGYLAPNNLSANAHGNGYSDPNIIVPAIIEAVQSDGGAFNAREGNHSVNVAETYSFHPRLDPFVTLTADPRDVDLAAGWSPGRPGTHAWIAIEAAYGNGFLDRLEHRRQYKVNGYRVWNIGRHQITMLGIGYFGTSMIPGLVPIDVPGLHDTIDPRQKDETHTT